MQVDHHLNGQLERLRLGGFLQSLELRVNQAQEQGLDYASFLQLMVQGEIERREAKNWPKGCHGPLSRSKRA